MLDMKPPSRKSHADAGHLLAKYACQQPHLARFSAMICLFRAAQR